MSCCRIVIPGYTKPDGRGIPSLNKREADWILYRIEEEEEESVEDKGEYEDDSEEEESEEEEGEEEEDYADPSIATYRVKRPCYGGGYKKLWEWKKVYPKQEVSDHRPRKLVLHLQIE